MANNNVTSGFFNSDNGDRKYDAVQISQIFTGLMSDGVIDNFKESLQVTPGAGLSIVVGTGRCWFEDTWTDLSVSLNLQLPEAEVAISRRDAIVIDINKSIRENDIKVIKGSVTTPNMVSLTEHQYPLAFIDVPAGATRILAENIIDNRGKDICPFVDFTGVDIGRIRADADGLLSEFERKIADAESGAMYMLKSGGTFTGNVAAYSSDRTGANLRNIVVANKDETEASTNYIYMIRK